MKNTPNIIAGALVIAGLALLGGYVSRSQTPQTPLKVGALIPLTGDFAPLGERVKNGLELAKEDIAAQNKAETVEIVYENACAAKDAVSATQKLIQADKIDLLGASFCVAGFTPSLPILEANKIIAFNTAPNPDAVLGHKYMVSTNTAIKDKAQGIANFAYYKLNAKTAAIIYYNTPLGLDYHKYIGQTFAQAGGKVVASEMTALDARDFRTELTKIKALNPDIIFVVQLANPLGNLLKQAQEIGLQANIMGNSSNEDPTVLTSAGQAAEGFIIPSDEPPHKTALILAFERRYKEKYGHLPDVFAANAYDALQLQVQADKKCQRETECMLKEFHNVKEYQGVSGTITINPDGSASKPSTFKVVENGAFTRFE